MTTLSTAVALLAAAGTGLPLAGAPAYEPAFVNGHTVTISAKDPFPGKIPRAAQNVYYEVIYPTGWPLLTSSVPQCNPCDHAGDSDDWFDYHDHVFSAEPSQPGGGSYGALWRLNFVVPAYNGNLQHDVAVSFAYASLLPTKSAQAVQDLLKTKLPDGSPVALLIDVDYVFLVAMVKTNAAH